jgi:drug/metabolite transporter (DMT)-like permease
MVPATSLGSHLALTLWIAGMKYTLASVAGILGQSSTPWILVFSVLFLHERFSRRKALAAVMAPAGVPPRAGRPDAGGTACSHASGPWWH